MSLLAVWEKAQNSIKDKIGATTYETWFSTLRAVEKDSSTLIIETPDEFFKNWIMDNYVGVITNCLKSLSPSEIILEYTVNSKLLKEKTHSLLFQFLRGFEI